MVGRLLLLSGSLCTRGFRLDVGRFGLRERGAQVGPAIGTKLDAAGQFLAAAVAEFGTFLLAAGDVNARRVTVGGVAVVLHDESAVNVTAHGQALGAHDLTVVNHKLLL